MIINEYLYNQEPYKSIERITRKKMSQWNIWDNETQKDFVQEVILKYIEEQPKGISLWNFVSRKLKEIVEKRTAKKRTAEIVSIEFQNTYYLFNEFDIIELFELVENNIQKRIIELLLGNYKISDIEKELQISRYRIKKEIENIALKL